MSGEQEHILDCVPAGPQGKEQFPALALYINRKVDRERRASIEAELRSAGMRGERIPAVEGLAVPGSLTHFFFNGDTQCSQLSSAEVGVYASHLMAARIVVDRGLEHALILEDDAEFPPNFTQSLKDILAQLPAGWDFVHLCGNERFATKPVARLEQSRTLVRYSRVPSGAFAYLISRTGAEKFLTPSKRFWPVDTDLRQPWRFGLRIYGVVPALVDHSDRFPSTIATGAKGERSRLRRGLPIPSRHCWTGNPLHTPEGLYFNLKTLGPLWWARCWLQNTQRRAARMLGRRKRSIPKSLVSLPLPSPTIAPQASTSPLTRPHLDFNVSIYPNAAAVPVRRDNDPNLASGARS